MKNAESAMMKPVIFAVVVMGAAMGAAEADTVNVWLDDLDIPAFSEGIRPVQARANYGKGPLCINGALYARGVGVQTISVIPLWLDGHGVRFTAMAGADDMGNKNVPVRFYVLADRKVLFDSGEMKAGDPPKAVDVDLQGVKLLGLLVTDAVGGIRNKKTYANWAEARLMMEENHMPLPQPNDQPRYILTPPAAPSPRINSARVFGARPGSPFFFTVAATGEKPITFSAEGLPPGVSLDAQTGILSGRVAEPGRYDVTLCAANARGTATQSFTATIRDTIALTPPMGWNGFNAWAHAIDREKVLASANAMVTKGLKDYGWTYVNIDDTWQGRRDGPHHALQPNEKFPHIKEMIDTIHALGLKAGLYSTPYIASYANYVGASSDYPQGGETFDDIQSASFHRIGAYRFEDNDARQMAEWGVDFLKYDWRMDVESAQRMADALNKSGRDIVFSLSNNAPLEKARDWMRLANMYRTGPDIRDSWTSLYFTSFSVGPWAPYTKPGHWPDPDMMILGNVATGQKLHPTRLTPDEQYSHMSLFCLLSAPLLIGCPVEQLDDFTLSLITNAELLDINQDPLGEPARRVAEEDGVQIWLKTLEDGSVAVGLFNVAGFGATPESYFRWNDEPPKAFRFKFAQAGLKGRWNLRDVWRQKDLGRFKGSFKTSIPHHGVVVLRMYASD